MNAPSPVSFRPEPDIQPKLEELKGVVNQSAFINAALRRHLPDVLAEFSKKIEALREIEKRIEGND